jgi:hypothetical protein
MAHYRGWGLLVLIVPFAWIFVMIGLLIFAGYYQPDPAKAAAAAWRTVGAGLALGAATLWVISHHRAQVAPGRDAFSFLPMGYFSYLVAAGAMLAFAMPYIGPPLAPLVARIPAPVMHTLARLARLIA